jgi:hypothetical protein
MQCNAAASDSLASFSAVSERSKGMEASLPKIKEAI